MKGAGSDDNISVLHLADIDWSRIKAVFETQTESLAQLARAGGLDPQRCFCEVSFKDIPLAGFDLRGVNLSSADLRGTGLRDAVLDRSTILAGAFIDAVDRDALVLSGIFTSPKSNYDDVVEPEVPSNLHDKTCYVHLVSDSSGETTAVVARAAMAQWDTFAFEERTYPLVRTEKQLDRVVDEISREPGIVLYTLLDEEIASRLEAACRKLRIPAYSVLNPVHIVLQSYLGAASTNRVGAQHTINEQYHKRVVAMKYTIRQLNRRLPEDADGPDLILLAPPDYRQLGPLALVLTARSGLKIASHSVRAEIGVPTQVASLEGPVVIGLCSSNVTKAELGKSDAQSTNAMTSRGQGVEAQTSLSLLDACAAYNWPTVPYEDRTIDEVGAAVLGVVAGYQAERSQLTAAAARHHE
jgi:regulator of PEP synthase PpsR (kinase-PPPase family)